jgi:hypothetical protein
MEQGFSSCDTNALQPVLPGIQKICDIVHRKSRKIIRIKHQLGIVTKGTPEIAGSEKHGRGDDSGVVSRGKLF